MSRPASDAFRIESAGELEGAVLYGAHDLLAQIVSPHLYEVAGDADDQVVAFKSEEAFDLFAIRVGEFLSEAAANVDVPGAPKNLSLLNGLGWVVDRLAEPSAGTLREHVAELTTWLDADDRCDFWCSELDMRLSFRVSRGQLWKTHANLRKHTPFRLQDVAGKLQRWGAQSGQELRGPAVLAALSSFSEWVHGYCEYHATRVAELLGRVFFALNRCVWERREANHGSNNGRVIAHPSGTSVYFADLHTSLLVFKRYPNERITRYTPHTASAFKRDYAVGAGEQT